LREIGSKTPNGKGAIFVRDCETKRGRELRDLSCALTPDTHGDEYSKMTVFRTSVALYMLPTSLAQPSLDYYRRQPHPPPASSVQVVHHASVFDCRVGEQRHCKPQSLAYHRRRYTCRPSNSGRTEGQNCSKMLGETDGRRTWAVAMCLFNSPFDGNLPFGELRLSKELHTTPSESSAFRWPRTSVSYLQYTTFPPLVRCLLLSVPLFYCGPTLHREPISDVRSLTVRAAPSWTYSSVCLRLLL
jgi:hypothetical protein